MMDDIRNGKHISYPAGNQRKVHKHVPLSDEDGALLARWMSGPGARPTEADGERYLQMQRDGVFPRISRPR